MVVLRVRVVDNWVVDNWVVDNWVVDNWDRLLRTAEVSTLEPIHTLAAHCGGFNTRACAHSYYALQRSQH